MPKAFAPHKTSVADFFERGNGQFDVCGELVKGTRVDDGWEFEASERVVYGNRSEVVLISPETIECWDPNTATFVKMTGRGYKEAKAFDGTDYNDQELWTKEKLKARMKDLQIVPVKGWTRAVVVDAIMKQEAFNAEVAKEEQEAAAAAQAGANTKPADDLLEG